MSVRLMSQSDLSEKSMFALTVFILHPAWNHDYLWMTFPMHFSLDMSIIDNILLDFCASTTYDDFIVKIV